MDDANILIVGPGAVGSLFAVRLGRRWRNVHVLDHRPERAQRLQESGFHLRGATLGDWTPPPAHVRADPRGWPLMDVALFCVKAPAVSAAWKGAFPVLGKKTAVLVVPGEVGPPKGRKQGREIPVLLEDRVRMEGVGRSFLEGLGGLVLDPTAPGAKEAGSVFREAGISVELDGRFDDRRRLTRLARACVEVPAALADVPLEALLEPPLKDLAEIFMTECLAVSKVMKKPLPPSRLRKERDRWIALAPKAKSSLGWDLWRGRPTERASWLDPLLAAARKARTPVPLLSDMDRLLRRLEKEGPLS